MVRVFDSQIANLVGLATYKALNFRWPALYSDIDYPMIPTIAHTQLVDAIISSSNLSAEETGLQIRKDLIRMVIDGSDTFGYASSLVSTSPKCKHFKESPIQNLFYFIWVIVWSLVVCMVLWKMRFVHLLLHPQLVERGLGISIVNFH